MSTLNLALVLSLQDRLVAPLQAALKEVEKNVAAIEKELLETNAAGDKVGQTLAQMQGPQRASREAAELARNTSNAIGLAERLNRVFSMTGSLVKGITTAQAAIQAGKMVLAEPMQKQRTYDRQLADAANTAFNDRDAAGRIAGKDQLNAAVMGALRAGGGSREEALAALNDMLASGSVNFNQAQAVLPTVQRYATAGNVASTDLAAIVVKALQNGFKESDIPRLLDQALAAGQAGGFELKDMAKWLPKLMAAGTQSGLIGEEGWVKTLTAAQASVITAGSKDEAGNNLLNLLLKINSSDTAQDAKKLGVDLSGSLAAARAKGVDSLTAFVNLVDMTANKDARFVALKNKAATASSKGEKSEALESQANILQGAAIGKLVQDRQALMALVALMNNRDYMAQVQNKIKTSAGAGDVAFATIASTNDFKVQQGENEKLFAQGNAIAPLNDALGKLADRTAELYQQYPGLGAAMEGTKLALGALSAMALAAGGALLLQGGAGRLLGLLGGGASAAAGTAAATTAGAAAAPAAATTAAAAGGAALAVPSAVVAGGLTLSALAAGTVKNNPALRQAFTEENDPTGMLGAMSGDMGFAAAIINASEASNDRLAKPTATGGSAPGMPSPELSQAASARAAANDSQLDLARLQDILGQPVDVRLKIDAPESLSIEQITQQVARAGRRGG